MLAPVRPPRLFGRRNGRCSTQPQCARGRGWSGTAGFTRRAPTCCTPCSRYAPCPSARVAPQENIYRNFGMPQPNGYRKALRFMRHADKFGFPIVTFVDTPGAYAGKAAEELGQVGVPVAGGQGPDLGQLLLGIGQRGGQRAAPAAASEAPWSWDTPRRS